MQKVCIIGAGYVGLVTGTCLAEIGHHVICIDNNKDKINALCKGIVPIYEPGLKSLIQKNTRRKRLVFSDRIKDGVKSSGIIFIAVNTPPHADGSADLSFVENVASEIARQMNSYKVIVEKSTVPIATCHRVEETIRRNLIKRVSFDVVSNPEFLREGSAIKDFLKPDRIVIGSNSKRASQIMKKLYRPIKSHLLITDVKSAELIKHASNSFLALKISFINAVSRVCDLTGADVLKVADGMGRDKRIGPAFLNAGVGYGGSCFPKDVAAFAWISRIKGYDFQLLNEIHRINEEQKEILFKKITDIVWNLQGKTITVLGLSFKPETDDLRNAPSLDIIRTLLKNDVKVKVHDPVCMSQFKKMIPGIEICKDPYDALDRSDCLVLVTEWQQYKKLNFDRVKRVMKSLNVVDGRNVYDPRYLKKKGFKYRGIGRS